MFHTENAPGFVKQQIVGATYKMKQCKHVLDQKELEESHLASRLTAACMCVCVWGVSSIIFNLPMVTDHRIWLVVLSYLK